MGKSVDNYDCIYKIVITYKIYLLTHNLSAWDNLLTIVIAGIKMCKKQMMYLFFPSDTTGEHSYGNY